MSIKKITDFDDPIVQAKERAAQEKRRKILQENRDMERQRKIDTRRKIITGAIIVKYFPEVLDFQPRLKEADTKAEFAELENFFSIVAGDPKYAAIFQEIIRNKMSNK